MKQSNEKLGTVMYCTGVPVLKSIQGENTRTRTRDIITIKKMHYWRIHEHVHVIL